MISIDELLIEVRPEFPNTPLGVLRKALRDSLEDFTKFTHVWTMAHIPINIEAGQSRYNLVAPIPEARINAVYTADYKDSLTQDKFVPLVERSDRSQRRSGDDPNNQNITHYYTPNRYEIVLDGVPNAFSFEGLKLEVSLFPDNRSGLIIENLYHEYREDIGTGAKYRLYAMKNKEWGDGSLAEDSYNLFEGRKKKARKEKAQGYIRDNRTAMRSRVYY